MLHHASRVFAAISNDIFVKIQHTFAGNIHFGAISLDNMPKWRHYRDNKKRYRTPTNSIESRRKTMKIISNKTGETIANILANHSMTLDEALDLVGAEPLEAENSCDPDYILNGVELWYDDLDLVPDNYGEESEDE